MVRRRRRRLGVVALDGRLEAEIERSGLLEVQLVPSRGETTVVSDDGARAVAWLAASGELAALLVQDYANGESRVIPFGFGDVELVADGDEIAVYLRPRR